MRSFRNKNMMDMTNAKKLANEHWKWQRQFLKDVVNISDEELNKFERIAIDYFIHGYKHGKEENAGRYNKKNS